MSVYPQSGFWIWSDGSEFSYKNWYDDDAKKNDKKKHCLGINYECKKRYTHMHTNASNSSYFTRGLCFTFLYSNTILYYSVLCTVDTPDFICVHSVKSLHLCFSLCFL